MSDINLSNEIEQTHQRIEFSLCWVEERLAIFDDGLRNWDESLPPFCGKPRRWPLDDQRATTVGQALRSRYGGYEGWALTQMLDSTASLARAFRNGHMTEQQQKRYSDCCVLFDRLKPELITRQLNDSPPRSTEPRPTSL